MKDMTPAERAKAKLEFRLACAYPGGQMASISDAIAGRPMKLTYVCDDGRHLVCLPYSIENLHAMAIELNINRCWFHNAKFPHYDIPKRRIEEIKAKCCVVTSKELLNIIKEAQ